MTQRAIRTRQPGVAELVHDAPLPAMPDDYILVKTKAVALNPTDWKHIDFVPCNGTVVGCDYAGVVEAVGSKVKKPFESGDRVCGFVHGCNVLRPSGGAFGEYVVAKGDLQYHIPSYMSFEEASTLGVGLVTIGQSLYQSLELEKPREDKTGYDADVEGTILIYGGATATGSLAIQFAKRSGLRVVTTCSEVNRSWMYELGADLIFDYHEPQIGDIIREQTDDSLELVLDTVSTPQTASICAAAISSGGGYYNALLDVQCPRDDVDSKLCMAYDIIGEAYLMGSTRVSSEPDNFAFGVGWTKIAQRLLNDRHILPHRYEKRNGGLAGVIDGLQALREVANYLKGTILKMKILCLHGFGTNPNTLESQMAAVTEIADPSWEFFYLAGEVECSPNEDHVKHIRPPYLCYSEHLDPNSLDAAHALIDEAIEENGPFDGALGFSLGAAVIASYLLERLTKYPDESLPIRFAIFCSPVTPFSGNSSYRQGIFGWLTTDDERRLRSGDDQEISGLPEPARLAVSILIYFFKAVKGITSKDYNFYLNRPLSEVPCVLDPRLCPTRIPIPTLHVHAENDIPGLEHSAEIIESFCSAGKRRVIRHNNGHSLLLSSAEARQMVLGMEWVASQSQLGV
ncbi:hypothetical protein BDV25DRAFT_136764 [Aspergillus avenaceus]|uniref:Enoyl reductase (ER) domain-containing protein n=1 Tax=Aspergillus avenaceus TaxID=36643 RepID=A0A5N6U4T1_ASPAV|nr:hypothetical protein BDV25DRAFT_136764 [Aspergillus avenaceus]